MRLRWNKMDQWIIANRDEINSKEYNANNTSTVDNNE